MSSATAAAASADEVQRCRLLELPGELKNEIYRLVVVTSDEAHPISLTAQGYERSALLLTCREIYKDAIKIYFLENWFHHQMPRFQSFVEVSFQALCTSYLTDEQCSNMNLQLMVNWELDGDDDTHNVWENLTEWLHNYHSTRVSARPYSPAKISEDTSTSVLHTMLEHTIGTMFMIAENLSEEPWEKLVPIFDGMRPSLVFTDEKWAENSAA